MLVDAEAASLAIFDGNAAVSVGMGVTNEEFEGHAARIVLGGSGGNTVMCLGVSKDDDPSIRFQDSTGETGAVPGLENGWSKFLLKNPHGHQSIEFDSKPFDDVPSAIVTDREGKKRVYYNSGEQRAQSGAADR